MSEATGQTEEADGTTAGAGAQTPARLTSADLNAMLDRVEKGDRAAVRELRAAFDSGQHPDYERWFLDTYGSPPTWLRTQLARMASGSGKRAPAMEEATRRKMAGLQRELEGPSPTPLERVLAERAVCCWFIVHYHETTYLASDGLTIRQAEFHQRRIDAAHRRFLSAVATLARVRKMALPALQVNIGMNQVNTATGG